MCAVCQGRAAKSLNVDIVCSFVLEFCCFTCAYLGEISNVSK